MKPAFDLQDSSPPSRIQLNVLGRRRRASCGMDTPCAFKWFCDALRFGSFVTGAWFLVSAVCCTAMQGYVTSRSQCFDLKKIIHPNRYQHH